MATKLFLRNTQANGIGATYFDMLTTAGASAATAAVTTTNGGTEIQWTQSADGAELLFISGRAPVGGFTLTTTDISIWAHESGTGVDAGGAYRIFKRAANGTETELGGGLYSDGVEFTKTTPTEMTWTGNPTDTAFAENDRILLKIKAVESAAGAMSAGTCTLTYNAADAATGDSFFNIAETVAFKAEETTAALVGQEATGSAGAFGKTVSTAVSGHAGTTAAGTLVPSTSYSAPLTGLDVTGSIGSFGKTVSVSLSGVEATAAIGSLEDSVSGASTGQQVTASIGSLGVSVSTALTGVEATSGSGTLVESVSGGVVVDTPVVWGRGGEWTTKKKRRYSRPFYYYQAQYPEVLAKLSEPADPDTFDATIKAAAAIESILRRLDDDDRAFDQMLSSIERTIADTTAYVKSAKVQRMLDETVSFIKAAKDAEIRQLMALEMQEAEEIEELMQIL